MFYIDFTTPEGKTYRIDVSKNPIKYECPVCGDITIYMFDPNNEDYCSYCAERRKEERRKQAEAEMNARLYNQLANFLSRDGKHRYTPEEAKQMLLKK
jgi:predicted RNA-binding Zn-ribbon protein involved in translation (DUF1610 family)